MKVFIRSLLLASVVMCASVAIALASPPKPGGTYVGGTFRHFPVRITVAPKLLKKGVYKGTFSYCGYKVGIFIVHGHFGVWKKTAGGAVSVFRAYGSFRSRQVAQGHIDLDFTSGCDGLPGAWTATLQ
jgi:hypothetical protein